jgi:mannose-6-phosphate isomerase-like protein (cupin superfamily)
MRTEELHKAAATYASNRKTAYIEAMKRGEVAHMSIEALNGQWLAHYEGYREGYWVATGDTSFSTDPAKLKEKNNG